MTFKKTVIATVVGVALSTSAIGVSAVDYNTQSLTSAKNALAAQQQAKVTTASGMHNQYDTKLGKTTFQWAGKNSAVPSLGAIATEHKLSHAADFYLNQLTGISANKSSLIQSKLSNKHDIGRGAIIAKYKQEVAGVEVFNREYNIMMDRDYKLVSSSGYFADKTSADDFSATASDLSAVFGDSANAVSAAFSAMGGDSSLIELAAKASNNKYQKFNVTNLASDKQLIGQPRAKKVFFEKKGKLIAAHYVEIQAGNIDTVESDSYSYIIAAKSGEVLFKNNLKSHASDFTYRVFANADGKPWDSPHGDVVPAPASQSDDYYLMAPYLEQPLVTLSHSPDISTEDAWLADDATETVGNNVIAYADVVAPDGLTNGDFTAETTSANTFDYIYQESEAEYSLNNRKSEIVNLFYVNNYLHNDYYDYGFDEASGNAQTLNYGRGGVEGDPLLVEVQDYSGLNNANMQTPADGASPRMQMYKFQIPGENGVDSGVTITSDENIGLLTSTNIQSIFSPLGYDNIKGTLVRLEDGVDTINDGCEAASNPDALSGNIAVIDRGGCPFVQKVRHAQEAGAIAVLIANNIDGDLTFSMGGEDFDDIVIPNVMISQNEAATLYAAMAEKDLTVSMFKSPLFKASAWDNGIVAHEWGHYISNRLVGSGGGLGNIQGRSMGEGWGDFHALLFLSEEDDNLVEGNEMFSGGYAHGSYSGSFKNSRRFPHSPNMEVNPLTFKDITLLNGVNGSRVDNDDPAASSEHDAGEIWVAILWDTFVNLVNDERHTYAEAKHLMKGYLVAGYKMTPAFPTYTEARDALLSAAYANDQEDYQVMLAAFARRGIGLGAKSPDRFSRDLSGVVESYKTELATLAVTDHKLDTNFASATSGYCSADHVLDKGETGTVNFTVKNTGSSDLSGVVGKVEVASGHNVTFENDGLITLGDIDILASATSAPIKLTLNDASIADTLVLRLTFPELSEDIVVDESYSLSTTVNYDFDDKPLVDNSTMDDMETLATLHDFTENVMIGGEDAKGTGFLDKRFTGFFPEIGEQYVFINNNGFTSDVAYETKSTIVGFDGDFSVSWFHYYDFESEFDGGVVEISVNGGSWADVTNIGGEFSTGYPVSFSDDATHALAGNPAFTGRTDLSGVNEVINFGQTLNGNKVRFRFRVVSDRNAVGLGWIIDGIKFNNITTPLLSNVVAGDTYACDNHLPQLVMSEAQEVTERATANLSVTVTDFDADDSFTYTWTQTAGPEVTLVGADTAELSFAAPTFDADNSTLEFNVSVSDGKDTVSESVSVTVTEAPALVPAPTPTKKSSSGGSTGLLALLLLPLALLRRRK